MKKRIIGLIGLMVLTANLFAGQIFYVTETGAGNKDGSSWVNAFSDVQDAIDAAYAVATDESPSEVWIAKGTYKHGSAMTMKNNVAIYGGFAGTETTKEERTSGNFVYLDGEGKYSVFLSSYNSTNALTNTLRLDSVTIQNGRGDMGGMYISFANTEITNCIFRNNKDGCYIYCASSTLINCMFLNNKGRGIYHNQGNLKVTNCTFWGNIGGVTSDYHANSVLNNCVLWGNSNIGGNFEIRITQTSSSTIDACIIQKGANGISSDGTCTFKTEPITADPKLQELADNGGNVQTIAVAEGSSAIGAGKVIEDLTTDARGVVRSTTAPTIGAYEYVAPPTITAQPTALEVYQGSVGSLSVSASGDNLTYQWYFNGEAIKGATSATLEFSNIQKDAQGSYYCEISNVGGILKTDAVNVSVLIKVFYVVEGGAGNKDGASWANAYADVQDAIDKASSVATTDSPSEVWIAKGTYKHGSAMTMKNNVAIYGGFAGTEISKEERVAGNNTILDGEGKYRVFDNNYSSSNKLTNSAKLDNVTIQNGYIAGLNFGAGIYNFFANPEIINCTFVNNISENSSGGAISLYSSNSKIFGCTFRNNTSTDGAAIHIANYDTSSMENIIIERCSFVNNIGKAVSHKNKKTILFVINCTFTNNKSNGNGGAFYNYCSTAKIINSTFTNNTKGAIYTEGYYYWSVESARSEFTNCIFWGNESFQVGRGEYGGNIFSNCIVQNGDTNSSEIIIEDPLLGEIGNYGGNVPTIPVGTGGSAIGAGVITEDTPTTDVRGFKRSTTTPTIGAFEYIEPRIIEDLESTLSINKDTEISVSAESEIGDVKYQWQTLNENDEWINIEDKTENSYEVKYSDLKLDGVKYRCVVSNVLDGILIYSNEVTVTPSVVSQATLSTNRVTIVNGGYAHLEVSHDAFEPSYKWYYSSDTGSTWVEIENSNSSILEFQAISSMHRYQYKCVITDAGGTSVESNKAVLIVNTTAITISQDIADTTAFIGKETVLSVSANSSSTLGYQWQVSTDNGTTWVNIKDATSSSLTLTPEDYELSGNLYRCKIDNGGGFIYSSNSTITVFKNVEITSQPVDLIVWNTKNAEFAVSATGDGTVKYQWQTLVGEQWQNIDNAISSTLLLENVSTEINGNKYRCVVSNEGTAILTSNEATLTVYKTLEITTQPKTKYTFEGDSTTFSVAVDAQGDVTYQWQELIADAWTNIENQTSTTFEIPTMENAFAGRKFRVVITNGGDEFISNEAELKLATPIAITKQPTIIDVAYIGKTATFSVEVSGFGAEFQWYVSGNYGTDIGVEIVGATGDTLSIPVEDDLILENVYFCKITNAKATLTTDLVYVNEVQTLSAFQEWSMANGLGVDASPSATPHNDGITNLEKFAFGLDASRATSYDANVNFKHTSDATGATLEFPVSVDAEGVVNVKALKSTDLINWTKTTATATGETSSDGKFKIYKVTAPVGEEGKVFLKLQVEEK